MGSDFLSTGQAARLFSVTPDTVLRWIRSGKLPARRTAGGHYRVSRADVKSLLGRSESRPVRYCWEYHAENREPVEGCESCIVYRSRALRCYELARLPESIGHEGVHCDGLCERCEYYRLVQGQATNVLVVTRDEEARGALASSALASPFNLVAVGSAYALSARIETFRPDYVVLDVDLGVDSVKEISEHLLSDPRLRLVRIILASEQKEIPAACDRGVFALLEKPITVERVEACLGEIRASLW